MMCAVNGVLDTVQLIDQSVKMGGLPPNFFGAVMLSVPIVTLPAAVLTWYLYQDATGGHSSSGGSWSQDRMPARNAPSYGAAAPTRFQAFAGGGQRLGSNV